MSGKKNKCFIVLLLRQRQNSSGKQQQKQIVKTIKFKSNHFGPTTREIFIFYPRLKKLTPFLSPLVAC